jgi:hypothetical protein
LVENSNSRLEVVATKKMLKPSGYVLLVWLEEEVPSFGLASRNFNWQ